MKKPQAVILPIPYRNNSGPKAIVNMLMNQVEDYDRVVKEVTWEKVDIIPIEELKVNGLSQEKMVDVIKKEVDKVKDSDKFLTILGGEHSISIGAIKSLKEKYENLTVLQIDAHLHLREDDSHSNDNPSKFASCCVMRRALDLGCSTVHVGIRNIHSGEIDYIRKEGTTNKVFECPVKAKPEEIIKAINSKNVYITIDVNGLDPAHKPGATIPTQGGLEWYFTVELLKKVFEEKNVVAVDIVEVSPTTNTYLTEYGAAQLLYHMIGFKYKKSLK